jgi:hypothetical protein
MRTHNAALITLTSLGVVALLINTFNISPTLKFALTASIAIRLLLSLHSYHSARHTHLAYKTDTTHLKVNTDTYYNTVQIQAATEQLQRLHLQYQKQQVEQRVPKVTDQGGVWSFTQTDELCREPT